MLQVSGKDIYSCFGQGGRSIEDGGASNLTCREVRKTMIQNRQRSRRQGFTLVEMLAVVAIVVILLGISAVGVVYYARWLKITELDNAAREIYLAAENRAVLLSGSGRLEKLVTNKDKTVTVTLSSDSGSGETTEGYYIHHSRGGSEVENLLPVGTIDSALMEGSFYIVYEPVGGSVTDVFYAETEPSVDGNFQAFYQRVSTSPRSARMQMKPMVGYYGGGKAENARDDALGTPVVIIENKETLTAEISYEVLPAMADKAKLTVKLTYDGCEIDITPEPIKLSREEKDGRVRFTCTILLDSLDVDEPHFSDWFKYAENKPGAFGGDFTVTATLTAEGATPSSGSDKNNSLFAKDSGDETAYIANLRHLQNLDKGTSGAGGKTAAEQTANIDCAAYQGKGYIFTPIQNDGLMSYNGGEYVLRGLSAAGSNAGLFAAVEGESAQQPWKFQNIRMVNARAVSRDATKSEAAGALAGMAANAEFENCWVYWEPEAGTASLRGVLGDNDSGYRYQIIGDCAGGLVGRLDGGTITNCLAATLVEGQTVAGGLVGQMTNPVTIANSYADCYLSGASVGGLVGTEAGLAGGDGLELTNCYAAGFVEQTTKDSGAAAGLCAAGKVTGNAVYSAVRCSSAEVTWEPLAPNMSGGNCYYLSSEASDADSRAKTYTEMTKKEFAQNLSGAFDWKDRDSHPYNLRTDLALTTYDFPGLKDLPHYGDWSAQFVEASLVYYEQYGEEAYGFYGGNVDVLQNEEPIKDGYAIAIRQEGTEPLPSSLTVTCGNTEYKIDTKDAPTVTINETRFYLVPLPDDLVNAKTAEKDFYQPLSFAIGDEAHNYYYCPHFAKTAVKADELPPAPTGVSVRTPRHLYMLSLYPEYYCSDNRYSFHQELNLDYAVYTGYELFTGDFTQVPIGRFDQPFNGLYDGGCHTIKNLVFRPLANTTRAYAGLFGYSSGTLRDIVYLMDAEKQNAVSLGNHRNLYIGGLAGGNAGRVENCAVAGVSLSGSAFTATIYVGGLVGLNQGEIVSCGAECAALKADATTYAHGYVGGLVGLNQSSGVISASYAVGRATAEANETSNARVCGFVGYNQGLIQNSYAAMNLSSSGKAVETYGFCGVTAGSQKGTFFLNRGNFTYREIAYNASYTPRKAAQITYAELTDRTEDASVAGMAFVDGDDKFPYPTAVRDADGNPVHYGLWPERMELGVMGVYYWEKLEIAGSAPTYHVSLMAVDPNEDDPKVTKQTTLSNAHSDNGVVTDYGYGYYDATTEDDRIEVKLSADGLSYSTNGKQGDKFSPDLNKEDKAVNEELAKLMPHYTFHSYHSFGMAAGGGGLYPTGTQTGSGPSIVNSPNGRFTLTQWIKNEGDDNDDVLAAEVKFAVNPHFADALAVTLPDNWPPEKSKAPTDEPGSKVGNPYEVRAVSQLQNINWNGTSCDTHTVLTSSNQQQFPYLSYRSNNNNTVRDYYWTQTHDLKGEKNKTYTPIAEYYDNTANATGELAGWFGGTYDGQDYMIENVSIQGGQYGASSVAGLFGVVYDGTLNRIILYSSDGTGRISGSYDTNGETRVWSAIGGLAGVAAASNTGGSAINNCSVAGYTIDASFNRVLKKGTSSSGNWGGAEIGGLVGITNCNLDGCSAVTNIIFKNIDSNDNVRVGGLAGSAIGTIQNCYAGGEIAFDKEASIKFDGGNIYIGGLVGGAYFKPLEVGVTIGPKLNNNGHSELWNSTIDSCYSYVKLPKLSENTHIKALYAVGGIGELNASGANDGKADHGSCTIKNSYYLGTEVLRNNNRQELIDETKKEYYVQSDGWKDSSKYNYFQKQIIRNSFRTDVNASGVTSLRYAQLAGREDIPDQNGNNSSIYTRLTAFLPVKYQTDDGFSMAGKYSYPTKPNLKGLNYPFPTILSRDGNRVHYGDWPLSGIKRDDGGAPIELDLFTKATHTEEKPLGLEGPEPGGTWSVEVDPIETEETNEDGSPVTKVIATAEIDQKGNLTVTGTGVGVTTVTVTYTDKKGERYSMSLSVNVTAVLELRTADSPVQLFTNDEVAVKLTAYGERGSDGQGQELKLEELTGLTIIPSVGVYDSTRLTTAEVDGDSDLTLKLVTGGVEGDTTVSMNYTYTYKDVEYTGMSAITFQVKEPEIKTDEKDENTRLVVFAGGEITEAEVTRGELGEGGLSFTEGSDTVSLDMTGVSPEKSVTIKVTLTMDGREHVVRVDVPAAGEKEETGGGGVGQEDGGEQTG